MSEDRRKLTAKYERLIKRVGEYPVEKWANDALMLLAELFKTRDDIPVCRVCGWKCNLCDIEANGTTEDRIAKEYPPEYR